MKPMAPKQARKGICAVVTIAWWGGIGNSISSRRNSMCKGTEMRENNILEK